MFLANLEGKIEKMRRKKDPHELGHGTATHGTSSCYGTQTNTD